MRSNCIPFQITQSVTDLNLEPHYGTDLSLIDSRRKMIAQVIRVFCETFPHHTKAYILRVPARINLMGVHNDHRGGWCNFIPVARETFFVFAPRQDDVIAAYNLSSEYPSFQHSIMDEYTIQNTQSWLEWIETNRIERGNWKNYIMGGALRLAYAYPNQKMMGMDAVIGGDIPPKSGLSSSSTLVVGSVLALREINHIHRTNEELVELCGEAEWYAGTRGGCGDHAAMLLGKRQCITHIGFKPVKYDYVTLPNHVEVILCQSGIEASKATNAREIFNSRIAAYEIALLLYKECHKDLCDQVEFIRDIHPRIVNDDLCEFYTKLKKIPTETCVEELYLQYPHLKNELDTIFDFYGKPQGSFVLRDVLLFGVAECCRSVEFTYHIRNNEMDAAGKMMYYSHDGDRVSRWNGVCHEDHLYRADDLTLDQLINSKNAAPLAHQPGGYRCSVKELDCLVDTCKTMQGVKGAGLTGAGLGGAILIMVEKGHSDMVIKKMKQTISNWTNEDTLIEVCQSAAGAEWIQPL